MTKDAKKGLFGFLFKEKNTKGNDTDGSLLTPKAEKETKDETYKETLPEEAHKDPEFGLSEVQALYLYGLNTTPNKDATPPHICIELSYPKIDPKRLEEALLKILLRHPIMRTAFRNRRQVVLDAPEAFCLSVRCCEKEKLEEVLEEQWNGVCNPEYSEEEGFLYDIRLTQCEEESFIDCSVALLCTDWNSIQNLVSDTEKAYHNPDHFTTRLPLAYSEYVTFEEKKRRTLEYMRDNAYWEDRMDNLSTSPKLPLKPEVLSDKEQNIFRQYRLNLTEEEWDKLRKTGEMKGFTPRSLLMSAYADALAAWSDNKDFSLQLILLKRPDMGYGSRDIVGNFATHILIHADRRAGKTFVDGNRQINQAIFEGVEHKSFSAISLMKRMKEEGRRTELIPYVFTDALGSLDFDHKPVNAGLKRYMICGIPQVYINCQVFDGRGGLGIHWDIRKDLFSDEVADGIFASFEGLIRTLCVDDSAWEFKDMLRDFSRVNPDLSF